MSDNNTLSKTEALKKKIHDNIAVNDDLVCPFCDALISLAKEEQDWQSVAFGHVWRADYYFYVALDMKEVSRELDYAQIYIDEKKPNELLEKFYTLKHVLYENLFDMQAAFHYSLKALDASEKAGIEHRIGANYGNLGGCFLDYECYDEALLYSEKAAKVLRSLPDTKPKILRILLSNLIKIYIKSGQLNRVKPTIEELSTLSVAKNDLNIYINYGYLLYYSEKQDQDKSLYFLDKIFNDGLMEFPNRAFVIEFLMNTLEAMMSIGNESKSKELLSILQNLIRGDEAKPLLTLCKLKIQCSQQFGTEEEQAPYFREYYDLYLRVSDQNNQLKVNGLCAKIELDDTNKKYMQSKEDLGRLHDLVNYDDLTSVYSRHYMNVKQEEILNSRKEANMGIVILDIDYFKEYNDYYGHVAGDKALQEVAACLQNMAGKNMAVCRYGGDEFVCLTWDINQDSIADYTKRVAAVLKEKNIQHLKSKCGEQVTLSIGYGNRIVTSKIDLITLFGDVDEALYLAKNNGRNNAKSLEDSTKTKGEHHA